MKRYSAFGHEVLAGKIMGVVFSRETAETCGLAVENEPHMVPVGPGSHWRRGSYYVLHATGYAGCVTEGFFKMFFTPKERG